MVDSLFFLQPPALPMELLYDTHAHLTYPQLRNILPELLQHAADHQVGYFNCVATDLNSTRESIDLANGHESIFATAGWHPNDCQQLTAGEWDQIRELAGAERVVAIGETGLDLYWKECPLALQKYWFGRHWQLARELSKPVIIHMRDCELEMLDHLRAEHALGGTLCGVMHSYSGSWDTAEVCLGLGLHISFAGMLTYPQSTALRAVACRVPAERLLVETDAPFLAPVPHRGKKPNRPGWVRHTAECLAELRGISVSELAAVTTRNAQRLFGVDRFPAVGKTP